LRQQGLLSRSPPSSGGGPPPCSAAASRARPAGPSGDDFPGLGTRELNRMRSAANVLCRARCGRARQSFDSTPKPCRESGPMPEADVRLPRRGLGTSASGEARGDVAR
jgi:hypothetical protein